jgi:regulatory protein
LARVTKLRQRSRGLVDVELDGAPWRLLPTEVVVGTGLELGEELSRPRLRELRRELRRTEALERAARALRYRDLSADRLRRRLKRRGTAPFVREEAVATLEAAGLVNDARVARTRAESLAGRGMGDTAIRFDLARQGLGTALIDEALAELEPETERARRLVAAHGLGPRTARLLARRGFGEDAVEAAAGPLDY